MIMAALHTIMVCLWIVVVNMSAHMLLVTLREILLIPYKTDIDHDCCERDDDVDDPVGHAQDFDEHAQHCGEHSNVDQCHLGQTVFVIVVTQHAMMVSMSNCALMIPQLSPLAASTTTTTTTATTANNNRQ